MTTIEYPLTTISTLHKNLQTNVSLSISFNFHSSYLLKTLHRLQNPYFKPTHLFLWPEHLKEMKETELTIARRLNALSNHLSPCTNSSSSHSFSSLNGVCSSTCSVKDSYHRVHGEVSSQPVVWKLASDSSGIEFVDIIYEKAVGEGIAKITINRPEMRNAFRPQTVKEMIRAFNDARDDITIGVIILTGKGPKAFCSGGDQSLRTKEGYADPKDVGRLNVLDLQVQIRRLPKPVIAMVGSFDAGYGSSIMSRLIGPKKAREMWFLARFYTASEAEKMGLVNTVVPLEDLEKETVQWCREILRNSPTAVRVLKSAINAVDDGHAGLQELAGNATLIFYGTEEGNEGKTAYLQRRRPEFSKFPRLP